MHQRSTVRDVAKLAKVGASTVSRYLRGVSIRADASVRVASAIEKLGYVPDEAARALRGGSSKTIGIVVPQVDNTFFSRVIQIIESEAHHRGFAIILFLHQEDKQRQFESLAALKRYRADGVILAAASASTAGEILKALAGTPVVAFDRPLSREIDSVTLRNREAARAATDHLLRHGYASIACVTSRTDLFTFRERIAGYEEAMRAAGKKPEVLEASDYSELRLLLASMLSSKRHPQALLSLSNMATGSILFGFNDLNLGKESRLPFIGFDDFDFAPLMNPSLSVVRQPIDLMVRYALDLLFRKIDVRTGRGGEDEKEPHAQAVTLAGELVCRQSCGCI